MIGWIILEAILVTLSIATVALSLSPVVTVICMVTALIPGFFIFQNARNLKKRKLKKTKSKVTHRFIQSRGKVLYFPEGGRRHNGTHKH